MLGYEKMLRSLIWLFPAIILHLLICRIMSSPSKFIPMQIPSPRNFLLISLAFVCLACAPHQKVSDTQIASKDKTKAGLFSVPYFSSGPLDDPVLVLVLHGDSPFNNPSYQYDIAKRIAEENDNVVAVGILRPGYKDDEGNRSEGKRGMTTGDNYTREVLAAINGHVSELKDKFNPSKVVLVGHSGGAAISANLLAEYPEAYAAALLIACPCDLQKWRAHMKALRPHAKIWDKDVSSLSPIDEVERMGDEVRLTMIHGDQDEIVPVEIARRYADKLGAHNKVFDLIILENQGHEIAFDESVFDAVKKLVE